MCTLGYNMHQKYIDISIRHCEDYDFELFIVSLWSQIIWYVHLFQKLDRQVKCDKWMLQIFAQGSYMTKP